MSSHYGRFKYKPIDESKEFRTLKILDDSADGKLRCRLTHHPLPSSSSGLRYDAISWTWGGTENFTSLIIVTDEGERLHYVRTNLESTLKGLRKILAKRSVEEIWIDAVCMNQDNNVEKSKQVKLMFEIYGYAQNVCIWLGDHEDNSELAMKFIRERVCDLGAFALVIEDEGTKEEWKAFAAVMNRLWFRRRWVVQELALAKRATVHCGDDYIDWTDFETAVALFEREAPRIAKYYRTSKVFDFDSDFFGDVTAMGAVRLVYAKNNLFRLDERGEIVERRFTLSDLVSNLSSFVAKDPHDLIYAVLSLAKDTRQRIKPYGPADTEQTAAESKGHPHRSTTSGTTNPSANTSTAPESSSEGRSSALPKPSPKRKATEALNPDRLTKAQKKTLPKVLANLKNIVQPENTRSFDEVDYKQPFFQVCTQFLRFSIPKKDFPNLDILCRPWAPKEPKGELPLPSWIPSLANAAFVHRKARHAPGGYQLKRKNADPLVGQTTYSPPSYNACRNQVAKRDEWHIDDRSLYVTGFVLDHIGRIEDTSQSAQVPMSWLRLGGWEPWDEDGSRDNSSKMPDQLWRTLVADRGPEGSNTKAYYSKTFEHAISQSTPWVGLQTTELKARSNAIMEELLSRMEAAITNRRLFKSKRDGNLGLAPAEAQKGDLICILRGCSVPVVLSPAENSPHYVFVGEAYLHTMMDGRAIEVQDHALERMREREVGTAPSPDDEKMRTQMFELR